MDDPITSLIVWDADYFSYFYSTSCLIIFTNDSLYLTFFFVFITSLTSLLQFVFKNYYYNQFILFTYLLHFYAFHLPYKVTLGRLFYISPTNIFILSLEATICGLQKYGWSESFQCLFATL